MSSQNDGSSSFGDKYIEQIRKVLRTEGQYIGQAVANTERFSLIMHPCDYLLLHVISREPQKVCFELKSAPVINLSFKILKGR